MKHRQLQPPPGGRVEARHVLGVSSLAALCFFMSACTDPTVPDRAERQTPVPSFTHGLFLASAGIYRIPYEDDVDVFVSRDHHTHTPVDRIDMRVEKGKEIVAAAGGWIRAIVEHNGNDPNPGDGRDKNGNPYDDDDLEHGCQDDEDEDENPIENSVIPGFCSDYNNYVWIEHPNGEWTKYSHLGTGTVSGRDWEVGQWINAGEVIGLENDIGRAGNSHLHFEVARPNEPGATLSFTTLGGFIVNATNRVPRVCDIPNNLYEAGQTYTADQCDHQPPTADAGGPYPAVDEGTPFLLNGTNSTDPEGRPLSYRWEPAEYFIDPTVSQPWFVGTSGVVEVTLTVYDQVEALSASSSTTITVNNVAPTVTIDPSQVKVITEGSTVTLVALFTDPGFLDTHTASVDWGVPPGSEGIEIESATVQVLDEGGGGQPLQGRVLAVYQYGDNDDGNGFTIEVSVTDSDGATGKASFELTVNNQAPVIDVDFGETLLIGGVATVVASVGDDLSFGSQTEDPGSDDLTLTWDLGDGTVQSRLSLVAPPAPDPLPSPTVDPRSEAEPATHAFTDACMYDVTFSALDDDGGESALGVKVLIVGNADQFRNAGYWTSEYRFTKNADHTAATLACYLDIVNHVSGVFSELRPLASLADAVDVLWQKGQTDADELLDRQLLTAWLNFANGAFALDELVDTTGDGVGDQVFGTLLVQAELLRGNPARTAEEVIAMKNVLEVLNGGS